MMFIEGCEDFVWVQDVEVGNLHNIGVEDGELDGLQCCSERCDLKDVVQVASAVVRVHPTRTKFRQGFQVLAIATICGSSCCHLLNGLCRNISPGPTSEEDLGQMPSLGRLGVNPSCPLSDTTSRIT